MLTEEQLAEYATKFPRCKHVVFNDLEMIFRKPTRAEVAMHATALEDTQQKPFADEQLARCIVVYPDRNAFASILEEYPYLPRSTVVGTAMMKLLGLIQDSEAKSYGSASKGSGSPPANTPAG
jgi:hypothetical protein